MNNNFTVVTNCNRNYLWGAYLLIASLRYEKNPVPVHVLVDDSVGAEGTKLLEQFGDVCIVPPDKNNPRNLTNLKPHALLSANTEYIGWFDSDTIAVGDITKYWIPSNGSFQSRFRTPAEMTALYRNKFEPGEQTGTIPRRMLDIWRKDVGENKDCAIRTTCTADNFTFHRRHLDFIKRWYDQLNKVIPAEDQGVVNRKSFAYSQTDEEVMNSLHAFSRCAPPLDGKYLLDKDPNAFVCHFGMTPKPWQGWQYRLLPHFLHMAGLVEWAQEKGYETLTVPPSLQRRNHTAFKIRGMAQGAFGYGKGLARRVLKK